MRYTVEGVNRLTRAVSFREIDAASEQDAVRQVDVKGIAVKKIWRVADDAPPYRPQAATPRPVELDSVSWLAVLCYLAAILAFIATLAILAGLLPPISGVALAVLWVMIPAILLLIAGALFHVIKLLKVIVNRGGPGAGS
jgi:hypothetical protein